MKNLVFVLLSLILISCNDYDPVSHNSGIGIYGKWEITSHSYDKFLKYLVIDKDNTWHEMTAYNYGFRDMRSGVCIITDTQIDFGYEIWNYKINGNQLEMSYPDNYLKALRNNSAPGENEWITPVQIIDSISIDTRLVSDFTFQGGNIIYPGAYSEKGFKKLNVSSGLITHINNNQYYTAMEWDGTSLWGASYTSIQKVDLQNGIISNFWPLFTDAISVMAASGNFLWCGAEYQSFLFKYDTNINSVVDTIDDLHIYSESGMASDGLYLYIIQYDIINKCTVSPFETVAAYRIKDFNIRGGIAFDGNDFWVSSDVYLPRALLTRFLKVHLP